jgi:hypothetical protein
MAQQRYKSSTAGSSLLKEKVEQLPPHRYSLPKTSCKKSESSSVTNRLQRNTRTPAAAHRSGRRPPRQVAMAPQHLGVDLRNIFVCLSPVLPPSQSVIFSSREITLTTYDLKIFKIFALMKQN